MAKHLTKTATGLFWGIGSMRRVCIVFLILYRACLSPLLGPACRFYPTCSVYAQDAIERHGMIRGLMMAARRLLKCHPFHPGGIDLVR
jgi:putative membrane protein insertion efficiency factor